MKEQFKEKQEELEELLSYLKVPKVVWHVSRWLLETLDIIYVMAGHNNHNVKFRARKAKKLALELYG